jgi:hypothetical protein
MMTSLIILLAALDLSPKDFAHPLKRVYVDSKAHVIAVTGNDKEVQLSEEDCEDAQLAKDGYTVGWSELYRIEPPVVRETIEVAGKLVVFKKGKVVRSFDCKPWLRSWGFEKEGQQVAVYSGGLHFSGAYTLYDVESGKAIDSAKDPITEKSPDWAKHINSP